MVKASVLLKSNMAFKGIRCFLREQLRKESVKGDFEIVEQADGTLTVLGVGPFPAGLTSFKGREVHYRVVAPVPAGEVYEAGSSLDEEIPADAFLIDDALGCEDSFEEIEEPSEHLA